MQGKKYIYYIIIFYIYESMQKPAYSYYKHKTDTDKDIFIQVQF